jgi:hypothetical protein
LKFEEKINFFHNWYFWLFPSSTPTELMVSVKF